MNPLRKIPYRAATRFATTLTLFSGLGAVAIAWTSGDGPTVVLLALFAIIFAFLTVATIIGELQDRVADLQAELDQLAREVYSR